MEIEKSKKLSPGKAAHLRGKYKKKGGGAAKASARAKAALQFDEAGNPAPQRRRASTGSAKGGAGAASGAGGWAACVARSAVTTVFTAAFVSARLKIQNGQPEWFGPTNPASNAESFSTRFLSFAYNDWFHFRLLLLPNMFCPDWRNSVDLVESFGDPNAWVVRVPSRSTSPPTGVQFDFVWLPARTPHGGAPYAWRA